MKWIFALLLALGAGQARAHDFTMLEGVAMASVVTDLASTRYALDRGARELNPLMGSSPGNRTLVLAGLVRLAAVYSIGELMPAAEAERAYRIISCIQLGITTSNLTINRDPPVRFNAIVVGVMLPLWL